jgi:hypothetical protein
MAALEAARDALAVIAGVASCKVGLEVNISPADYPLVRLVPVRITPGVPYGNRTAEVLIYFGAPTANSEGLEEVYRDLFALEANILRVVRGLGGRYRETITDEDRMDTYKLMAARVDLAAVLAAQQTITFAGPGNQTMGVPPPALSATATSGLSVAFTSRTPAVCTVSGSALTLVSAGSCILDADQAGNDSYSAAPTVSRTITVAP